MKIKKFLRVEKERIYLKAANGTWKNFSNVLRDILEEKIVKLKKRSFKAHGRPAWGVREKGKDGEEIWVFSKLPQAEIEKTLIHEIIESHYNAAEVVEEDGDEFQELIDEISEKIWQNESYRIVIQLILSDAEGGRITTKKEDKGGDEKMKKLEGCGGGIVVPAPYTFEPETKILRKNGLIVKNCWGPGPDGPTQEEINAVIDSVEAVQQKEF